MKIYAKRFTRKKYLAVAIPLIMAAQAQALQMDIGEIEVSFDSQFSLGSSWRVEGQDASLLNYADPSATVADGSTSDDGNRNYKKGDAFSQIFKGSHDLQFTYENFGGFVRGKYWYDSALANNNVKHGHGPTVVPGAITAVSYDNGSKLDDSNFNDLSKASGATVLDAFVYGSFDLLDMPLDVRIGKQVVSWGESTFIGGGINAINPVDASAFRRPGAEIKEGLLPVNMAYANLGLTDNLSLEAFYQLGFQETVLDACGTYFSTSDVTADGCTVLTVANGGASVTRNDEGAIKASDDGQFGMAVRYFADELDTEFGFYAMNLHSRLPVYSATADTTVETDTMALETALGYPVGTLALTKRAETAGYYIEYPEDTQLAGVSFSSNFAGVAVSGEVSHKFDAPMQINGVLTTAANLNRGTAGAGTTAAHQAAYTEIYGSAVGFGATGTGHDIKGYRNFDVTQAQVTLINLWNQVAGASQVSVVGEVGASYIHDFDDVLRYGRSSTYNEPKFDGSDDGFVTETSWGYRALVSANYTNVVAGIDVRPTVVFSHDVDGYAAAPGGAFTEGAQTLGFTVQANYLSKYRATLAYKQFMGGDYNVLSDRDFASVSVDVQF